MPSLSQQDADTLSLIGHDVIQTTVALVVEAILYSKFTSTHRRRISNSSYSQLCILCLWSLPDGYYCMLFRRGMLESSLTNFLVCSRKRSKFPTAMFLVILTMFVLDTAMCILDVHNAIQEITLTLTSTAPLSLTERYTLLNTIPWSVTNSLFAYMVSSHIARTRITL